MEQTPVLRTECIFCSEGSYSEAGERSQARSNVRRFRDETFPVWRCPSCRSIHSLRSVDLDHYYRGYPLQKPRMQGFMNIVLRRFWRSARGFGLNRDSRLLDYGCGDGTTVRFFRELGCAAEGYDPYGERFGDASVLKKEHYDFVVLQDVLEHVEDPDTLVSQLSDYLRPGGFIGIGTPDADGIDMSDELQISLHQPFHLHIASSKQLAHLIERNGLRVARLTRRSFYDTRVPCVNWRFVDQNLRSLDRMLDCMVEYQSSRRILRNPRLVFWALFGYLLPLRDSMLAFAQKPVSG